MFHPRPSMSAMVREGSLKFAEIREISVGAAEVLRSSTTFAQIGPDSSRPVRSMKVRSALAEVR